MTAADSAAPAEGSTHPAEDPPEGALGPDNPEEVLTVDANDIKDQDDPEEVSKSGVPKVLKAYVVSQDPKITLIPSFLNNAEVDHLIELAEEGWIPSVVGSGVYKTNDESKDLKNKSSKNRTSFSCMLKTAHTPMVKNIELRIARIAEMDVDYLERLNMVRYAPGQFFNKHHDGRFRPKTVFIYLNDLPDGDGGETYFPELGVKFTPRKGCAIMWANTLSHQHEDLRMVHQGLPPRTHMKYGVNCFFNDKPLKQYEGPNEIGAAAEEAWNCIDAQKLEANSDSCVPGELRVFCIVKDPRILVAPRCISAEEADTLIKIITEPDSGMPQEDRELLFNNLQTRIAALTNMPLDNLLTMKLSKCAANGYPEMGSMLPPGFNETRCLWTEVFIFLNDCAEGGELRFPKLGIEFRPRTGCAVVWPPVTADGAETNFLTARQARPPATGFRYAASCLFQGEPFQAVNS